MNKLSKLEARVQKAYANGYRLVAPLMGFPGIKITGDQLFNASVHKYSTNNLTRVAYRPQLKEDNAITLNLDYKVSGVGGTSNSVLNQYRVILVNYDFTFYVQPIHIKKAGRIFSFF